MKYKGYKFNFTIKTIVVLEEEFGHAFELFFKYNLTTKEWLEFYYCMFISVPEQSHITWEDFQNIEELTAMLTDFEFREDIIRLRDKNLQPRLKSKGVGKGKLKRIQMVLSKKVIKKK